MENALDHNAFKVEGRRLKISCILANYVKCKENANNYLYTFTFSIYRNFTSFLFIVTVTLELFEKDC